LLAQPHCNDQLTGRPKDARRTFGLVVADDPALVILQPQTDQGNEVGVAQPAQQADRAELLKTLIAGQVDNLDGQLDPARARGLPDLPESATTQEAGKSVPGDHLIARTVSLHGGPLPGGYLAGAGITPLHRNGPAQDVNRPLFNVAVGWDGYKR